MTSAITVNGLVAKAGFGQIALSWQVNNPFQGDPNRDLAAVEVWSSIVNDWNSRTLVTEGQASAVDKGLPEDVTFYYWIRPRDRSGNYGEWFPLETQPGVSGRSLGTAGAALPIVGGQIVPSASAGVLTIALKTLSGKDPDLSDPIFTAFRDQSDVFGNYQPRTLLGPLSVTISSGSSLNVGSANNPFRIWVLLFDDAGIYRPAVINCRGPNGDFVWPLTESNLASAVAEGGAGGADSDGVIYAGVTITSKPFRIIGYMEWSAGLSTPGTWTAPDIVRLRGPAILLPSQVVQTAVADLSGVLSNTTTIPFDNTPPQNSEGSFINQVVLTPSSTANLLEFTISILVSYSVVAKVIAAILKNSETNARLAPYTQVSEADGVAQIVYHCFRKAEDAAQQTWTVRIGGSTAGRWTVNGVNNAAIMGVPLDNLIMVKEIQA